MIESTNPEIDVNELMERVRAEAARMRKQPRRVSAAPKVAGPALPPIAVLPPVPTVQIPRPINPKKERLDQLLQNARIKTRVSSIIPRFLRGLFRNQDAYNTSVLESIGVLTKSSVELNTRVRDIALCLERFNGWLLALNQHREADANWMTAATPSISMIAAQENELRRLETELGALIEANDAKASQALEEVNLAHSATTNDLQQQVNLAHSATNDLHQQVNLAHASVSDLQSQMHLTHTKVDDLQSQMDRAGEHLRNLQAQADGTGNHLAQLEEHWETRFQDGNRDQQIDHALAHLKDLQGQADRLGVHINNLQGFVDQQTAEAHAVQRSLEQRLDNHAELDRKLEQLSERQTYDAVFVKGELSEQQSLLHQVLGTDRPARTPTGKRAATDDVTEKKRERALDSFYLSFENRFRGSRAEIKKRVKFYLPFLASAQGGKKGRPILDLGCGRGEWLELLKENKLGARGVDMNSAMIAQCKELHLDVIHRDALDYMRSLRASSHGGVSGFHIIEHLPFETLMDFFREARRILKPGGVAIFESPNCKNLVVGAANFNIDPTHRNPVFPETAEFMLQSHGFERIQIEYLSPVADVQFDTSTRELAIVKDMLYGPQDFGIIAYKPAKR